MYYISFVLLLLSGSTTIDSFASLYLSFILFFYSDLYDFYVEVVLQDIEIANESRYFLYQPTKAINLLIDINYILR